MFLNTWLILPCPPASLPSLRSSEAWVALWLLALLGVYMFPHLCPAVKRRHLCARNPSKSPKINSEASLGHMLTPNLSLWPGEWCVALLHILHDGLHFGEKGGMSLLSHILTPRH